MKKNAYGLFLFLLITAILPAACQRDIAPPEFYRGINGRDTAYLTLNVGNNSFYGKYEVRRSWYTYRTGDIRGTIKGDTLIGDFLYTPYGGGDNKRTPIALLRRDSVLVVGKGVASSYMGIPIFVPNVPIDYDHPAFVLVRTEPDGPLNR